MSTRQNLVIVRAGPQSLHDQWLDLPDAQRSFDLVISYYDRAAYERFVPRPGVTALCVPGGKWDGLYQTLTTLGLGHYDYFWLPDDDIATTGATINRIFALTRQHGLTVAQPALTHDSYFTHFMFYQCPGFKLRYTNFIEIMVPCLGRAVLQRSLPLFHTTMSGFGLDYIWCRWPESGAFRAAILDEIAVHHTRPIGQVLTAAMAKAGRLTPPQEEVRLRQQLGIKKRAVAIAFAGVLATGTPVSGRLSMARHMAQSWLRHRAGFREATIWRHGTLKMLRRQLIRQLDMQTLLP